LSEEPSFDAAGTGTSLRLRVIGRLGATAGGPI
jgi:hypothetical protein